MSLSGYATITDCTLSISGARVFGIETSIDSISAPVPSLFITQRLIRLVLKLCDLSRPVDDQEPPLRRILLI